MKPVYRTRTAFSLVELSIVLVLLGLLAGGVLSGQALIKASELRAVTTELTNYVTAVKVFREKYFMMPGDMNNATLFWGKNAAKCGGDPGAVSTTGTCNGNGDNFFNVAPIVNGTGEMFQFWHQLSLAQLVTGTYTGYASAGWIDPMPMGDQGSKPDVNVPKSRYGKAVWSVENAVWAENGDGITYRTPTGNVFMLGGVIATSSPYAPALTPEDAENVDLKMDDGRPGYGRIVALYWNNRCSTPVAGPLNNTNLNMKYRVTDATIQCALKFRGMI